MAFDFPLDFETPDSGKGLPGTCEGFVALDPW